VHQPDVRDCSRHHGLCPPPGCLLGVEIDEVASELDIAAVARPAVCRLKVRENARARDRAERSRVVAWPRCLAAADSGFALGFPQVLMLVGIFLRTARGRVGEVA
jgi:hypothetical protein